MSIFRSAARPRLWLTKLVLLDRRAILDAKCLAEKNGGLYITAETEEELIVALEKTLSCPMVTEGPGRR